MTTPILSPSELAFGRARESRASLGERLAIIAQSARVHRPHYMKAVDELVDHLIAVGTGRDAPAVGETMPSFTLPDQDGRLTSLEELLADGPVVLAIHRGHWCPYCRLNMIGLAEIADRVEPARIVAISTETQQYTRMMRDLAGATYPFLSDIGATYSLSLGLAMCVDQALAAMIAEVGWDVPLYQGGGAWVMPIPAVFIVKPDGIIAARHVDPDYRQRMDLDELISEVARLR